MSAVADHRPVLCPHGIATSWTGMSRLGERLPVCEHCEDCNPDAVDPAYEETP